MSMSLDGFVAGPDVSVEHPMGVGGERLHQWLFAGEAEPRDAEGPWGEDGTFHLPCFVLTHRPAEKVVKGPTSFTFVTDGIESALACAQAAAGDRAVNVMGAEPTQQLLRAGLVDEIQINLVPVLLGGQTRLFENLGTDRIELERMRLVGSQAVTHLTYRIVK